MLDHPNDEQLLQAIRREADRLFPPGEGPTEPNILGTQGNSAPGSFSAGASPTPGGDRYRMEDFMGFSGQDLIRFAYRAVLGRDPDPDGFRHYLEQLARGRFTAVELVGALRYSREGRRRGVRISGLFFPFAAWRLSRLRVIGPIFRPLAVWFTYGLLASQVSALSVRCGREREGAKTLSHLEERMASTFSAQDGRLRELATRLESLERLPERVGRVEESLEAVSGRLGRVEENLNGALWRTDSLRRAVLHLDRRGRPDGTAGTLSELGYQLFEDAFRGSDAQVQGALSVYLPLLRNSAAGRDRPVLDLGCGRGEWLTLLRDHGYRAVGVDASEAAAAPAREAGLDVVVSDVETYLDAAAPASFGAVTAFHLLEHLPPERWLPLLSAIHRVLAPGGLVLLETPNPRHLLVGSGDFHRDPGHLKPVFPDTLQFLGEAAGFLESTAWFFDEDRTRLIRADAVAFDSLDDYLRVSRDFAWTGRKPR